MSADQQTARRPSRRSGGGPTVADVARLAGVSSMTVSRVVNGEVSVIAETRAKVEAAIAQLNYIPNLAARSLAGRGQYRLALLYDNPSAAFMSDLLLGCLEQVREASAQLLVEPFDRGETIKALCTRLRKHRVDGVLLPALLCDDLVLVEGLRAGGFGVARIAATRQLAEVPAVGIDDEAAAFAMTRHLIDLGHRRIGFIAGPADQNVSTLRAAGYARALRETQLPADPALVVSGDFTYRSGMEAAEKLLSLADRPSAIFASNDDMAAAAVAVAHRHHLEVPTDLSVCGFDDTTMARSTWPELTTIRQPVAAMAGQAICLLVDQVRDQQRDEASASREVRMDFELVSRASVAPPPR
jgi:LacI family transcriptional regulator